MERKIAMYGYSILNIPATFLHELSHLIVALLLGLKVKKFKVNLFPEVRGNILFLGCVQSTSNRNSFIRNAIVSMSPLLLILLAGYIYFSDVVLLNKWITFFVIVFLVLGGIPSLYDLEVFFNSLRNIRLKPILAALVVFFVLVGVSSAENNKNQITYIKVGILDYYFAKEGDTLQSIAKKYNLPVKLLMYVNKEIKNPNEKIKPNQKIKIPRYMTYYHIVKKGETMYSIARKYGISPKNLIQLNKKNKLIKNPDLIKVGQWILIYEIKRKN